MDTTHDERGNVNEYDHGRAAELAAGADERSRRAARFARVGPRRAYGADPLAAQLPESLYGPSLQYVNSLSLRNITFKTTDPVRLADFWAAALGLTVRRDSQEEILLAQEDWSYPRFTFQRVGIQQHVNSSPVHLDLTAADMTAEVRRLVGLGATEVEMHSSEGIAWTVMQDPDGNEFCVAQEAD